MKVFHEYIDKLIKTQEFVDVYTDEYDESHYGYIVKVSDELLILESFTGKDGQNEGIMVFRLKDISRINWEGNEIQEVKKLVKQDSRDSSISNIDITTINTALESINKKYGYVEINIQDLDGDVCFIGEIESLDADILVLNEYGSRQSLDRTKILLKIKDITRVDAGRAYSETIKSIYVK